MIKFLVPYFDPLKLVNIVEDVAYCNLLHTVISRLIIVLIKWAPMLALIFKVYQLDSKYTS